MNKLHRKSKFGNKKEIVQQIYKLINNSYKNYYRINEANIMLNSNM